jgi:D-glycerate 3-kinase
MNREEFNAFLAGWLGRIVRNAPVADRPLLIGLSAPQGAGKTTLTRELADRLAAEGLRMVSISLDDFYLTHDEQRALAKRYPENPLLQHRGSAGTHDVGLGVRVLTGLKTLKAGASMLVPAYNRFAFHGVGDRFPKSEWRRIEGPLDLVVFEGWMLGFTPVEEIRPANPHLKVVNEFLKSYAALHSLLDGFIWLEAEDYLFVREWRVEAEERSRASGHSGMTREQVSRFIDAYLPSYAAYIPGLRAGPPTKGPHLHILIGADRLPKQIYSDWDRADAATAT